MSRAYAAARLLEHGGLNLAEFREITGWPVDEALDVLRGLIARGVAARRQHARGYLYLLIEDV